jgi:hypothetical protein
LIILCPVILFKNPPSPPEKSGVERHSIIWGYLKNYLNMQP